MVKFEICDSCNGLGVKPKKYFDSTKELQVNNCTHDICPDCGGTGMKDVEKNPSKQIQKLID